jgi:hypothetical protein
MRRGVPINVECPVSSGFIERMNVIQSIYLNWDPLLHRVPIQAPVVDYDEGPSIEGRGGGLFFTGGVDSFHTLLTHANSIDSLIYVHGFDLPLKRKTQFRLISKPLMAVAAKLEKSFILVRTNLRKALNRLGGCWEMDHGAALAAVGILLSGCLRDISISSSFVYSSLQPWGTHPDLDPRFSTEHVSFRHRGAEFSRIQKIEYISHHPITWNSLRVCWQNREGKYNCGECDKCFRTAVELSIVGALKNYRTLPFPLDLQRLRQPPSDATERRFAEQHLVAAIERNSSPELISAMRETLSTDRVANCAA